MSYASALLNVASDYLTKMGIFRQIPIEQATVMAAIVNTVAIKVPNKHADGLNAFLVEEVQKVRFRLAAQVDTETVMLKPVEYVLQRVTYPLRDVLDNKKHPFWAPDDDVEAASKELSGAMNRYLRGISMIEESLQAGMASTAESTNTALQKSESKGRRRIAKAQTVLAQYESTNSDDERPAFIMVQENDDLSRKIGAVLEVYLQAFTNGDSRTENRPLPRAPAVDYGNVTVTQQQQPDAHNSVAA